MRTKENTNDEENEFSEIIGTKQRRIPQIPHIEMELVKVRHKPGTPRAIPYDAIRMTQSGRMAQLTVANADTEQVVLVQRNADDEPEYRTYQHWIEWKIKTGQYNDTEYANT